MNHITWVQQREDFNTKYHVLKWKTSHFHEPFSAHAGAGLKLKDSAAAEAAKQSQLPEGEGIGYVRADRMRSGRIGLGLGAGLEDYALKTMQEELVQSAVKNSGNGLRAGRTVGAAPAVMQTAAAAQTQAAEHLVTPNKSGNRFGMNRRGSATCRRVLPFRRPAGAISKTSCRTVRQNCGSFIRNKRKRR